MANNHDSSSDTSPSGRQDHQHPQQHSMSMTKAELRKVKE